MKILFIILFACTSVNAALPNRLLSIGVAQQAAQTDKKLIYFWATWCTNCSEKLITALPKFQEAHKNVSITTVSLDTERDRVEHYVKKQKVTVPVLFDPQGTLSKEMDISAVPYWIVYKKVADQWEKVDSGVTFDTDRIELALR